MLLDHVVCSLKRTDLSQKLKTKQSRRNGEYSKADQIVGMYEIVMVQNFTIRGGY